MTRSIFRPLAIGTLAMLVFARSATSKTAPVVGGLWSGMSLTLLVLPAAYTVWRRHQMRVAMTVSLPYAVATTGGAA